MISFSIRSIWDTYLTVRNFPPGSEILFTAYSIPDMHRIVTEHGLVPVPIDIDPYTLAPISVAHVTHACTPRTRAIIFAYMHGVIYDLAPYVHSLSPNIDIIEDCAQSFSHFDNFQGNARADLSMWSFGLMKHSTCGYGAIARVKGLSLYQKLNDRQKSYKVYESKEFA